MEQSGLLFLDYTYQMQIMRRILIVVLIVLAIKAYSSFHVADFSVGECVQNRADGFVWRINSVGWQKYLVQGWFGDKWGIEVPTPFYSISDDRYVVISCPFSQDVLKPEK